VGHCCERHSVSLETYGGAEVAGLSATVALGATDGGAGSGKVAGCKVNKIQNTSLLTSATVEAVSLSAVTSVHCL
jgi:hypothetical protein